MVSKLDYLLLEHVVFSDDLDFCLFWECYSRGALNRFFVVLILIGTRAVLIMKVSSAVNICMRWVFNFCLFLDSSYRISALNVKSWGGVEYDMV